MRHILQYIFMADDFITVPSQIGGGGLASLPLMVDRLFTWLMWAVGVIGVTMIVYSGFQYVISVGNPQKTKMALQSIIYTAVGFGIAILARSIVAFFLPVVRDKFSIGDIVTSGLNLFLWAIGIASVIMVIVAGMLYVFSSGDPSKTKTAKDAIMYAMVGMVVALMGGAGIQFLNNFLK